ncbi:MAG: glycine betaine ABC transporter substrate-binding protein, partial [Candidatus Aminicenantes bacterium]
MSQVNTFFEFILSHQNEILEQTLEHIGLTVIALSISVCVGLPLGILLTRKKKLASPVLGIVGVIQTIPSVALLGFLLPLLGIGVIPAIVALFLYALLPIVRNTYTGIDEVDPSVKEAALGMGMRDTQILGKIELPLAVPVIFAGIRTATVINVGIATLCALIASGGLGEFIFRGIALNNVNMILAGAIPAAALALLLDSVLSILQKFIRKIIKPFLILSVIFVAVGVPLLILPSFFDSSFQAGFTAEFMERADGYPGLRKTYQLELDTVELDPGLMYRALKNKKVDVICGFSTDGRIKAYNFKILKDDKNYFPPYHAAPLVRGETLRKFPVLRDIFSKLEGKISNEQMADLNYRVDRHKESPSKCARDFLKQLGLQTAKRRGKKADITIGAKNFTEQYILAHLFAQLIESYSPLKVELKTGLAGTKICFDALRNGQIDLYPEYTGTGLLVILDVEEQTRRALMNDEQKVFNFVKEESNSMYDLEWLQPLGFNNSYALMMRKKQAEKLNIRSISDLK